MNTGLGIESSGWFKSYTSFFMKDSMVRMHVHGDVLGICMLYF